MPEEKLPNYMRKILRLQQEGKLPPGRVTNCVCAHDDWCGVYEHRGCNCDPDIYLIIDGKKEKVA